MSCKKIAVLLYLFHIDKWYFYRNLLLEHKSNIKLFLTLCADSNNKHIIDDCKKHFKGCKITIVPNRGLDLLPFLESLQNIDDKQHPYFIKLHAKKSIIFDSDNENLWNSVLSHSLLGSNDILQSNINNLNDNIGAGCLDTFILSNNERQHTYKIQELCRVLKIDYTKCCNKPIMTGGIFIGNTKFFKDFFNNKCLSILKNYLEYGKINESKSTYVHALECIISYFLYNNEYKIHEIKLPSIKIYNKEIDSYLNLINTFNNHCYIVENPVVNGRVMNTTEQYIEIAWDNTYDKRSQRYIKIKDNTYQRQVKNNNSTGFDVVEYKSLNRDLIHLSDEEAEEHYLTHGIKEQRVYKLDTIEGVFDKQFYAKKYNIKPENALYEYIKKGRFEDRIYNSLIEDGFDYSEYICSLNLKGEVININQYEALKHFKDSNTKDYKKIERIDIIDDVKQITLKNTKCIYVASIRNKNDKALALQDLFQLKKYCNIIYVYTDSKSFEKVITETYKDIQCFYKQATNYKWMYECYIHGLETTNIKKHYNTLLLTNKTVIVRDLENVLKSSQENNADFISLTSECSKHVYNDCLNFKLHHYFLFFKKKNDNFLKDFFSNIIKTQATYTLYEFVEFEFTKHLFENKKVVKSFLRTNDFKNVLWNSLHQFNVSKEPDLLYENKIPIIDKQNLYYFTNLIPQDFIKKDKNTLRLTQWLESDNIIRSKIQKKICAIINVFTEDNIDEFAKYIRTLYAKCNKIIVYITGNFQAFEKLKKRTKKELFYINFPNKGMDIGPFMNVLKHFLDEEKEFDYIVKLQEKRTVHWRKYMFDNIINNLEHYCKLLDKKQVSICAPYRYLLNLDSLNETTINYIVSRYDLPFNYAFESTYNGFIGGTMFIMKHSVFNSFIDLYNINLEYEISILEEGSVVNDFPTYTHAWERMFTCVIPTVMETELKCI